MQTMNTHLWVLQQPVEKFIDTFCDAQSVTEDFKNALGAFTPCFTDVVILGLAHLTAVVLCILRLTYLRRDRSVPKYYLKGFARVLKFSAVIASLGCLLIVLFQFNARLAADPGPLLKGKIAPFEWAEYGLAAISWALFLAVFIYETDRYTPRHGWMIRFPILFIFAGEIAKLRFVVLLSERKDYFFWLYVVYFALQGWLALMAAFFYPDTSSLAPNESTADFTYEELYGADEDKLCPEATANIFSNLTFGWISPLMVKGFKRPLQFEDIWELPPDDRVSKVSGDFEHVWQEELNRPEGPSLTRACWRVARGLILVAIPFKLVNDASQFIAPVFINLLLGVVANGEPAAKGYFFAGLMFAGLVTGTLCDAQHFQRTMRAGFRLRALLVHQVFKKVLFLTPGAQHRFTSGRIFNLVTSDAETLQQLCQNLLGVISSPARIIGAVLLLYAQLGPASLVALLTLVIMIPIQAVLVRISARLMRQSLQFTDERSKLEGELVGGIDVVKCSAWEDSFWDRIQGARNSELGVLWRTAIVASFNAFLLNAIPVIVSVATFTAYVLLGHNLTAAKAFTALSLFTVLRMPLFQLPQLVTQLVNAQVALQRLQELLAADQQPPIPSLPPASPGETAIKIQGDFAWEEDAPPSLKGVQLDVPQGSLIAVVGETGSGKTSLLSAGLGLMKQVSGPPVEMRGKVAFVPQTAFIFGGTVRDNILFGLPYEESRYQKAVQAAALGPDLVQLPAGDKTELGERGVNVSGGQKQRVSIARAIYSGADIVLLDDPLSALDAKVAREVYNGCVRGELNHTTRILVTNQLQFVNGSDLVLFMDGGRIAEAGTYSELMKADKGFAQLMQQAEVDQEVEEELEEEGEKKHAKGGKQKGGDAGRGNEAVPGTGSGNLTESESRAEGRVSLHVLWVYIRALGGIWGFGLLMSWFILVEAARLATTLWLSHWTGAADRKGGAPHPALWYLAIYAAISGGQMLFQLLSTFLTKGLSLVAARAMHNNMLKNLLRVPMSFFHTTPMGRIINRLTKDTSDVDKNLADFASFFLRSAMQLLSTVALIGFETWFTLPALAPILLAFYLLYAYFQASVREIKRLDAISRSPVYGSIGEELAGLATIRAYRAEGRLITRNADLIDRSVIFSLVNQSMNRWLSVRLETLGALAALAAAVLAVEQRGEASVFGLVLSYALQITVLTSITVRLASLVENCFNAVERIDEFCTLNEEAPLHIPGSKPDGWPGNGKVDFESVKMRYRPGLPLVLRGLSVTIEPRSRVGVVGRTGAGKSSLINCLFRLMELDSGKIVIDGVDIAKMGLHQLRASMSLIPQTPVLFTGTMRSNLSPFGEHTDAQCWTALRRAHLAQMVESSPTGLDMMLSEGGAPLSAGQKQLVALARALLRHSKILVLDEATASVDANTDALIQQTVSSEFADCTIIAIAHRLHTVIDADRVLVMDRGEAAEYGSPAELLSLDDGVFTSMVRETGEASARFLTSIARGEIDPRADQSAQAQRALKQVQSTPKEKSCRETSENLLAKARETSITLESALAILTEHASAEEFRRRLNMDLAAASEDNEDVMTVHVAMKQAMEYLGNIEALAAKVNQQCSGAGSQKPPRRPSDGPGRGRHAHWPSISGSGSELEAGPSALEGNGLRSMSSMPLEAPGRASMDAPRELQQSAPAATQNAIRQWARLRAATLKGRRRSTDYARLAGEDPSLSNDLELR